RCYRCDTSSGRAFGADSLSLQFARAPRLRSAAKLQLRPQRRQRRLSPPRSGKTLSLLDADGPGEITHVGMTIASREPQHLKKLVLRMWWDGEATPSVEAPVGDFFGLGLADYVLYHSAALSVGA